MSPLEIEILMKANYYINYRPSFESNDHKQAIQCLVLNGLIKVAGEDGTHTTTLRGQAHVNQLCSIAWPIQAWIGSDGKVIEV